MEALGIMGFIFGLAALGKILLLEKQLKEKGVLEQDNKEVQEPIVLKALRSVTRVQDKMAGTVLSKISNL